MELEDRIRRLEDREAIRERLYEYGYRLDERDWAGWAALFTEDGVGDFEGWRVAEGRDELEAFGRDVVGESFEYSAHVTHNPLVEVEGDRASARRYVEVFYALTDGTTAWRQGRYDDRLRRVDGEWLFASVSNTFFVRHAWAAPEDSMENVDGYGDIINVE